MVMEKKKPKNEFIYVFIHSFFIVKTAARVVVRITITRHFVCTLNETLQLQTELALQSIPKKELYIKV